ncbi:MAG: family pyridoxal phosphate enzyme [Lasallia pustulata]|uniref:Pyridoxal phosphate homeostasis protein n=1 Tax=Lasallia pustulata TaxID=136370 RepID=A0A5M8PUK1_9LECA|nr:MAG: family pyridoxal phosphate enzyme [Lasallia pustulata]
MESHTNEDMKISPQRAAQLVENIKTITGRIKEANTSGRKIRLVAVSKLKPANDILALHNSPHSLTHFGENYQQELQEKASILPRTVKWHFIGALQTNKCRPLSENIPNLWCVESVDTSKKADQLEKGRHNLCEREHEYADIPLNIFVQVNTSGEAEKSGVEPGEDATALCRHIKEKCPHLKLQGVMTIGAIARSKATTEETENEDFIRLREVRDKIADDLGISFKELELSMGMSEDFESAIRCGSDEVRVGTGIFGERPPKKDAKVKENVEDGND